jgi:hypothetical protein
MSAQWVRSSTGLPNEGDAVEFVLDGREVALAGVYAHRSFQSRWSGYEVQRVCTWRPADMHPSAQEPDHPGAPRLAYFD